MRKCATICCCLLSLLIVLAACEQKSESSSRLTLQKEAFVPMQLIILGPPGAGKGTQAKMIRDKYKIFHISTGDILRAEVAKDSDIGQLAKTYMNKGDLVPDEVVLQIVEARLAQPDCRKGFILDGFPRTIPQADGLTDILVKRISKMIKVINLKVPDDVLMARMLSRGRDDDTEETIKNRIKVYYEQTTPLIDYYKRLGALIDVNGDQTIEDVFKSIRHKLDNNTYEFNPEIEEL